MPYTSNSLAIPQRSLRHSFQAKIIVLCLGATIGALILAFSIFEWRDWSDDREALQSDQIANASILARESQAWLMFGVPEIRGRANAMFESDDYAIAGEYFAADGRTLVFGNPQRLAARLRPDRAAAAHGEFRDGLLEVHSPVMVNGRRAGELVQITSQAHVWTDLARNSMTAAALSVIATLVAAIMAMALARRVLRPLANLDRAIEEVTRTRDFGALVAEPASMDELGRLTRNFNDLLRELKTHDDKMGRIMAELTAAKDAAEEANVMKSQFLANMSHEIRTPLNGVLGMAQVMALNPLTPAQKERLDVIQQSGSTLLSVLNDLLDLSKIEAGHLELEDAPFDIAEVAAGAYATFTSIANAKGLSFALKVADDAQGSWRGDSVRLRQMLYNLISNALKFTSEGSVQVCIDAAPHGDGKALRIAVSDTGIGIAPEALPRLFDKFVQADNTTTRRFGGTGLGLTICRHIAQLMDGTITVSSTLGLGTVLTVLLPLTWLGARTPIASPPALQVDSGAAPDTGLGGLKVLAAEDNATNQLVLKTVLHAMGLEPLIVENGAEAVDAWAAGGFDVILMDIQMPGLDGVAATREIRKREKASGAPRIPIVALSANAMKHQVAEYLAAGMDGHLAKPIQLDRLYATLLAAHEGRLLAELRAA
jgi:signal transduction histidine kinase/ActR/RegA family two-component response regulator